MYYAAACLITGVRQCEHITPVLATSSNTSTIQSIHPHVRFIGWHCSCILSWQMFTCHLYWSLFNAVCWQPNMRGQEVSESFRWRLLCHCRANAVEVCLTVYQPDITFRQFTQRLKTFLWLADPWRLRTLMFTAPTRNTVTYLLTIFVLGQLFGERCEKWENSSPWMSSMTNTSAITLPCTAR